ncbi:MAG: gluconate:H+ symporter [Verrucomicrobiales bacterium]|nr:gluconate:H+ symporter [Verrucomicrobiales bacterium]
MPFATSFHSVIAQSPLPVGSLIALLAFGIIVLLVMILRFKWQAFIALLVASIVVALGAVFVNGKAEPVGITNAAVENEKIILTVPGHGRELGSMVAISGVEPGVYNGRRKVVAVPDANTLVFDGSGLVPGPFAKGGSLTNPYAISLTQIGGTVVNGMGSALGFIATIIGVGAIFGALLEHSGGTQSLAKSTLRLFGEKKAPWAMLLTGFIISIPVFLDVALVILAPLLYALARDTKKSLLTFGLPLVAGMAVTHAFVPPTPGPVAVGYILGVNLGWVIAFGVVVGLPTALICGPWLCSKVAKFVDVPLPDHVAETETEEASLPPVGLILLLIALPIGMILASTIVEQIIASGLEPMSNSARKTALAAALATSSPLMQIIHFLGHPVIALLGSTLLAIWFLGTRRGGTKEEILELCTRALGPAGIIILITGAGGVFKGVLISTGIADALADVFGTSGIPIVALAYIFATLVRIAQGSATVAMLTAAGLMAGFTEDLSQPMLALITVAIAAGATGFSHVNDSGFWMISRYMGMTEKQTLKTWTLVSTAISLVSFGLILILSLFVK